VKRGDNGVEEQGTNEGENPAPRPRGRSRRRVGQGKGKEEVRFGAWNLRTMVYKVKLKRGELDVTGGGLGKEELLCQELDRKRVDCTCISEHRWTGQGEKQHGEYTFLFSGPSENIENHRKKHGVGIVMNKRIRLAWEQSGSQVKFISQRLIAIRFKIKGAYFKVISVYAPSNGKRVPEDEKEEFLKMLREEISNTKADDSLIILGDFNARVGTKDEAWSAELGLFGLEERNDAGETLLSICGEHRLKVMNTCFKHKQYGTWMFPRFNRWYTLDHIIVRQKYAKDVRDCRVICDAECDTDHRLMILDYKTGRHWERKHEKPKQATSRPSRLQVDRLKDPQVSKELQNKIHDKMHTLATNKGIGEFYRRGKGGRIIEQSEIQEQGEIQNIFTDGSCFENRHNDKNTPAGWGVYVENGPELYGPVITDDENRNHIGAEVGSNNTGELTAIAEALYWLDICDTTNRTTIIYSDSEYAIQAALGQSAGMANAALVDHVAEKTFQAMRNRTIYFCWVKGHSNTEGNEKADKLAKSGAEGQMTLIGRHAMERQGGASSSSSSGYAMNSNAGVEGRTRMRCKQAEITVGDQQEIGNHITFKEWATIVRKSAEEVVGSKESVKKPQWQLDYQEEIKEIAQRKRAAFLSGDKAAYKRARNKSKRDMKRLLNKWWRTKADEIEDAAIKHDTRAMYDGLRNIGAVYDKKLTNPSLKAKGGQQTLNTKEERKQRWREHHNEQLNVVSETEDGIVEHIAQMNINESLSRPLSKGEVRRALRQMRKRRAPGIDGIETEVLRSLDGEQFHQLYHILQGAWMQEVPQEFKDAFIINLPKKVDKAEDLQECDNWRGISLLTIAGKVFTKIINQRLTQHVIEAGVYPESQNGRSGRSTTDGIHWLRLACEYRLEKGFHTYLTFYDLKKAYDKIPREALWKVLGKIGVSGRMLRVIKELHEGMKAQVEVEGELTDDILVNNGVRQGCCLASLLFTIYSSMVTKMWNEVAPQGIEYCYSIDGKLMRHANTNVWNRTHMKDCHYVDDAVSINESRAHQGFVARKYQQTTKQWGQEMSIKKTKSMCIGGENLDIPVENGVIEEVEEFKYLGVIFTKDGRCKAELKSRLKNARAAFSRLWRNVWGVKQLSLKTKMDVYKASVLSVLLYGSETWAVKKSEMVPLERFHMDYRIYPAKATRPEA